MNILTKTLLEMSFHGIDFLVENEVIVKLKAVELLHNIYKAQLFTCLRAMDKRVGLLLNFNVEKLKDGDTLDHLGGHRGG